LPHDRSNKCAFSEDLIHHSTSAVYFAIVKVHPDACIRREVRAQRAEGNFRREWRLASAASNLLKLFRDGWVPEMA